MWAGSLQPSGCHLQVRGPAWLTHWHHRNIEPVGASCRGVAPTAAAALSAVSSFPAAAAAADLIALLTIYNAAFAVLGVWLIDGGLPVLADMPDLALFTKAVVLTACTGLTAAVLYQRALGIAPLSLTVPYLAFAPVFVVSCGGRRHTALVHLGCLLAAVRGCLHRAVPYSILLLSALCMPLLLL